MASIDDDSMPLALTVSRDKLNKIMRERAVRIEELTQEMYAELNDLKIYSSQVTDQESFETFLTFKAGHDSVIDILNKYYLASEDGKTGLIPMAAGQVVDKDIEHRLRFDRLLHEGLPQYLVASDDALRVNVHEFGDENTVVDRMPADGNTEVLDLVPVDWLNVLDETIGAEEGGELGRVFKNDLRGTAGTIDLDQDPQLRRVIAWASGIFNNARDNSGEALIAEALTRWRETGQVDVRDLQQVVQMTVHISHDHSTSTGFRAGNQACCNMFAMDARPYPVPTTGGWLRIEEPLQFLLLEYLTNRVMAWSRVVGGHKRLTFERRPNVPKQFLGEEMAMILYPLLVEIMDDLMDEFDDVGHNDMADIREVAHGRVKKLGEEYLKHAADFEISEEGKGHLSDTRHRVAEKINTLLAEADAESRSEIKDQLELLSKELADQFGLNIYKFTVSGDGSKLTWVKQQVVNIGQGGKEELALQDTNTVGEQSLANISGDNVSVQLSDGTIVILTNVGGKSPGSEFSLGAVCNDTEGRFLAKVKKEIVKQFTDDGKMLLLWPDILEAVKSVGRTAVPTELYQQMLEIDWLPITINGRNKIVRKDKENPLRRFYLSTSMESRYGLLTANDIHDLLLLQAENKFYGVFDSSKGRDDIELTFTRSPFNEVDKLTDDESNLELVGKVKETIISKVSHSSTNYLFRGGSLEDLSGTVGDFVKLLQEQDIPYVVMTLPNQRGILVQLLDKEKAGDYDKYKPTGDESLPQSEADAVLSVFLTKNSYDMSKVRVVLLVGGSGERLWPLSTSSAPKQFISVAKDGKTMLRRTLDRVKGMVPIEQVHLLCIDSMRETIRQLEPDFPEENIIGQPMHKDTGPAIGYAAAVLDHKYGSDTTMVVLPADHEIADRNGYYDVVHEAIRAVQTGGKLTKEKNGTQHRNVIANIGINPSRENETGYGYVALGDEVEHLGENTHTLEMFTEKPKEPNAIIFVSKGHLWNAGMFVMEVGTCLAALKINAEEEIYKPLMEMKAALGTEGEQAAIDKAFEAFVKKSWDFYVMDHLGRGFIERSTLEKKSDKGGVIYDDLEKNEFLFVEEKASKGRLWGKWEDIEKFIRDKYADNVDEVLPLLKESLNGSPIGAVTVMGKFSWLDVGNLSALPLPKDSEGNKRYGRNLVLDNVSNTLVYNCCSSANVEIEVKDVDGLIIVTYNDVTLVMDSSYSSQMKVIVDALKKGGETLKKYLVSRVNNPDTAQYDDPSYSDSRGNVRKGLVLIKDTEGCVINSYMGLVVAFGVSNLEITKSREGLIVERKKNSAKGQKDRGEGPSKGDGKDGKDGDDKGPVDGAV